MRNANPRALRVLHAIKLHGIGGVEVVFQNYLKHSRAEGIEHFVLETHRPCHPSFAADLRKYAHSVFNARHWRGLKIPPLLRAQWLRGILRAVRPEAIVIYNSLNEKLWEALRKSKTVKIYYEHGIAWRTRQNPSICRFLREADVVLCNSRAARRMLELRWGLPARQARVIHNPLRADLVVRQVTSNSLTGKRPLHLGLAGRVAPSKGFPLAIHALRLLLHEDIACHLHIAGGGPEEERLRTLVRRLGLEAQVRFHGPLLDMAAFYAGIDIFLLPSIMESLGNVAIEAGYMGRPVICSAVDGLPEVVVDGKTGFCLPPSLSVERYHELGGEAAKLPEYVYDPGGDSLVSPRLLNPADLAAKVRFLYEHPDILARMSLAAHEHIASSFRLEDYVERINGVILEAAAS